MLRATFSVVDGYVMSQSNRNKPILEQTTVLDLVPFGEGERRLYALRLTLPDWPGWKPGQFVMLRKPGAQIHLLARPFSICRVAAKNLVLFFQVAGKATDELAQLAVGDVLDIWGPLGNTIAVEKDGPTLLLAGGVGIAPFVGYVEEHPAPWNISMEFGHTAPLDSYPMYSLNEKILVDNFWERKPEDLPKFIDRIEERMAQHAKAVLESPQKTGLVVACGPLPFMKTVQKFAEKYKVKTQLCMENRMACGVGACLGCVVKVPKSEGAMGPTFVQVCSRGPNFWSDGVEL